MHNSEAFFLLKPVCDEVVKNPSKKCLKALSEMFNEVSPGALLQLQDYVLYPLELNLQRPNLSSESRRYIVECINQLILCTEVTTMNKFLHLFSLIFIQLFDKDSPSMVANVPEELKVSVIQCATTVTQKCTDDIVGDIYNKNNIPRISQGIFICVHIMQIERLKSLRIAAIEFLKSITQVDGLEREIEVWKPSVADTVMFIVPGILTGLHKVAVGDEKQGHVVTKVALEAWSKILVLVLEDIVVEKAQTKVHFSAKVTERIDRVKINTKARSVESKDKKPQAMLKAIQSQHRNAEWAESVADNVTKMSESLRLLQQHSHWKVRLELAEACHHILDKCLQHLKVASVTFVEILLNLSDDDANQVASASQAAVRSLSKKLEEHGISLYEILEENFYGLVTKLPRIIHVESDSDKLSALRLLKQYLVLLGSRRLPQLMHTSSHLLRTMEALLQVAELQSSNLSLLNDCSLRDLELNQDTVLHTPWKKFKHFADKSISQKLEEVLKLLGQNADVEILCNHLLELLGSENNHRNETVFLINEIILGGVHNEENIHVVKNTLDMYLSPALWYVPLTVSATNSLNDPATGEISTSQVRSNLQLVCLLAEGVGNAATALGTHFSRFLMHCLYLVVERAGSPHEALTTAGLRAAAAIAKAVNQGQDITCLLSANMDYFMVQVSLRLRNLRRDPGVLSVLSVAMRHSNKEMLPYLQNAVADVLLQSCDTFQMHHTSSFLHVFYTFFLCIKKWFPNKGSSKETQNKESRSVSFIVREFMEYMQNSQICKEFQDGYSEIHNNCAENVKEMSVQQDDESEYFEKETKKSEVPSHIQMTVSVLQRCLHLLPRKDKQCRLQALEAINEGLEILADYEDQLLPMIHQVWSPLVGRLQDTSDALLLNRSFILLTTLARLAQDFIRTRTLKQVWPALCSFLSESAEKSRSKNVGSAYQFSQLFKLQLCLLQGLGDLASHLQLQEKEIYQMLTAAVPYLSVRQPKPLQENCVKLFGTVAAYDSDAVWLEMIKIKNQVSPNFKDNREYIKNVTLVLELHTESENEAKEM